jgi:hypothetical protein
MPVTVQISTLSRKENIVKKNKQKNMTKKKQKPHVPKPLAHEELLISQGSGKSQELMKASSLIVVTDGFVTKKVFTNTMKRCLRVFAKLPVESDILLPKQREAFDYLISSFGFSSKSDFCVVNKSSYLCSKFHSVLAAFLESIPSECCKWYQYFVLSIFPMFRNLCHRILLCIYYGFFITFVLLLLFAESTSSEVVFGPGE